MSTEPSEKNPMAWLHEDRPESGVITDREKRSQYFRTDKYSIPLYEFQQDTQAARAQSDQGAEPVAFGIFYKGVFQEHGWSFDAANAIAAEDYAGLEEITVEPVYTHAQPAQQGLADRYRRQLFKCQDELNNLRSEYYNRVAELEGDIEELRNGQDAGPVAYAIEIDGVVHNIGFDKRSLEIVARQVYGRTLQIRPLVLGDAVNKQRSDR